MTVLHHLGYHIVIDWSNKAQLYWVTLPDWSEDCIQPATHGRTLEEAFKNGKEVLEMFHKAANDEDIEA
jgi:predicted RNase H-like HicB family nuclease